MKKILIIDDNASFRKTLSDVLISKNYHVSNALNGIEGLEKIDKEKPDLIILDISMPEMGGIEFLEKINQEGPHIPILIASQVSQIDTVSESLAKGVSVGVKGYILKSSESFETILQTIEKTLKESGI